MFFLFIFTFLAFPAHPKYAPSLAGAKKREIKMSQKLNENQESYFQKIANLMKTRKWVPIVISCGIEHGVMLSILTLLNQIVKPSLKNRSVRNRGQITKNI